MRARGGRLPRVTADFEAGTATFRPPRLRDAPGWSAARIADEDRLRPAFGDPVVDWAAEQSELAFVERCVRLNRAAARGLAVPGLLTLEDAGGTRVIGEVGIDGVDRRTGTGEVSAWSGSAAGRGRIVGWATALLYLHAFTMPMPLRRIVAPQATHNTSPPRSLTVLGAIPEITLTKHRFHDGELADHRIWVVHNTATTRAALRARLSAMRPGLVTMGDQGPRP